MGILPRMMYHVFDSMRKLSDIDFIVRCSYLEIYNEKIKDLLDSDKSNLLIKEDKIKGIYIQNLTEVYKHFNF